MLPKEDLDRPAQWLSKVLQEWTLQLWLLGFPWVGGWKHTQRVQLPSHAEVHRILLFQNISFPLSNALVLGVASKNVLQSQASPIPQAVHKSAGHQQTPRSISMPRPTSRSVCEQIVAWHHEVRNLMTHQQEYTHHPEEMAQLPCVGSERPSGEMRTIHLFYQDSILCNAPSFPDPKFTPEMAQGAIFGSGISWR